MSRSDVAKEIHALADWLASLPPHACVYNRSYTTEEIAIVRGVAHQFDCHVVLAANSGEAGK